MCTGSGAAHLASLLTCNLVPEMGHERRPLVPADDADNAPIIYPEVDQLLRFALLSASLRNSHDLLNHGIPWLAKNRSLVNGLIMSRVVDPSGK